MDKVCSCGTVEEWDGADDSVYRLSRSTCAGYEVGKLWSYFCPTVFPLFSAVFTKNDIYVAVKGLKLSFIDAYKFNDLKYPRK